MYQLDTIQQTGVTHGSGPRRQKMKKISAVYQIKNLITGDRYVGSSKNVYRRWTEHKRPSVWKHEPNKKLYQDFQKYGVENFMFAILAPVEPENLRQVEQEFIELLQPTYNSNRANGWDVERRKETVRAYNQSEKQKAYRKGYLSQLCYYNGETMTLNALRTRFKKAGIPRPFIEAKKYLIQPKQR